MSSFAAAAESVQLQFLTHELPPFNFSKNGEMTGMAVDVMRELQRRINVHASFVTMPFARAYMTATTTPDVVLFSTIRDQQRESLFHWVGPIAYLTTNLYVRSGSAVKIDTLADARRAPLIIVRRGTHMEQTLRKLGFTNLRVTDSVRDSIRMLLQPENKNALALLTSATVPETLGQLGLQADAIQPVYTFDKSPAYIAISQRTPVSVARNFQTALDDMKRDGTFDAIHTKWLPHEKPPGMKVDPSQQIYPLR